MILDLGFLIIFDSGDNSDFYFRVKKSIVDSGDASIDDNGANYHQFRP